MKVDFDMLEKLAAAGATAEVLIEVLKALDAKKAPKRERERKRQQGKRKQQAATIGNIEQQTATVGETASQIAERELYAEAKRIMGKRCGGLVSSLIRHHNYDLAAARRVIDAAASKQDAREYVVATMRTNGSQSYKDKRQEEFEDAKQQLKSYIAGPDDAGESDETSGSAAGVLPFGKRP